MKNAVISSRTMILLIGAVLLCAIGLTGAIGATQAALTYESEDYQARIAQTHLGVALYEQTGDLDAKEFVSVGREGNRLGKSGKQEGVLLEQKTTVKNAENKDEEVLAILGADKQMIPGKAYKEKIFAQNVSDDMGEYVRLIIRKYWVDSEGSKISNVAPDLLKAIQLGCPTNNGWVLSEKESTDEMFVFYYKDALGPNAMSEPVINTITLDSVITNASEVLKSLNNGSPEIRICLTAEVDAVQTNHVADAVKSAWGISLEDLKEIGVDWKDVSTIESVASEKREEA